MKHLIFGALFLTTHLLAIDVKGGDGPTPFSRIPAPKRISIPLQGMVSSFAVLESTDKLAYLDSDRMLRVYDFNQGQEAPIGGFATELFPAASPDGKAVLSSDLKTFKKVIGKGKGQEIRLPGSSHFLLWDKTDLYLLKKLERVSSDSWQISYLVYQQDKNQVRHRVCDFYPENNPKTLKVAGGNSPSEIVLYSEKPLKAPMS